MTPSQTVELRPSSPPAVKIVCYIYRLSVGDKAWQTVTPSVTQHRMSSVFWRGIVGQHKSFFFFFFFLFFFFSIPELVPLAMREDEVSTGLWFVLLHLQKVFFCFDFGQKHWRDSKLTLGKNLPKNNLEITTKIRTSQKKNMRSSKFQIFFIFIETFLYQATEHYILFGYQNFPAYPRGYEECWKICSPTVLPINASSR